MTVFADRSDYRIWTEVVLFWQKHQMGHAESYLFSISKKASLDQSIQYIFHSILETEALLDVIVSTRPLCVFFEALETESHARQSVILFSNLHCIFVGYFDPAKMFLDNENIYFSG